MARPARCAAAVLTAALLIAAAPDYTPALRGLQAQDARVATIAWRLTTANVALCRDVAAQPGIVLYDAAEYAPAIRPAARTLFGLRGAVTVAAVVPGSAAARAGLMPGDTIDSIDGVALRPESPAPAASPAGIERARTALDAGGRRITLAIRRGAEARTIAFTPDRGCASFVELVPERDRNAQADGRIVAVSTALADATHGDDELAIVIAHELAHNILHHRVRLDQANVSRGLFAGFGRNGAALRRVEDEADRVGLYLAARAGYDPAAAPRFWARFGRETDPIMSDGTHPGWRTRVAALTATAAEIAMRRATNRPLVPPPPPVLPLPSNIR